MWRLLNPIVLAGFVYILLRHLLRYHWVSVKNVLLYTGYLSIIFLLAIVIRQSLDDRVANPPARDTPSLSTGDDIDVAQEPNNDGVSGRTNAIQQLDANGDGFLIYVGASGPVIECVIDYGTADEKPCDDDTHSSPRLPYEVRRLLAEPSPITVDSETDSYNPYNRNP